MKKPGSIILVVIASLLLGCVKSNVIIKTTPSVTSKSDTSTNLISNTDLAGNWNIVTDSVYLEFNTGADSVYHGTPADHYIFTKYGNLYVKNAFNNQTDTAVYTISGTDTLRWIGSYVSEAGFVTTSPVSPGPFVISSLGPHSLALTQSVISPFGPRYEQITFTK